MDKTDEADIDRLTGVFYSVFDNRGGRAPAFATLGEIIAPDARITKVSQAGIEIWSLDEFIAPRLALLTDGRLVEIHEWEVAAKTTGGLAIASRHQREQIGSLARRCECRRGLAGHPHGVFLPRSFLGLGVRQRFAQMPRERQVEQRLQRQAQLDRAV